MNFPSALLSLFLVGVLHTSHAQDVIFSDSLKQALHSYSPEEKLDTYWLLAREYAPIDTTIAEELMSNISALKINQELSAAMITALKGIRYESQGEKDQAIDYYTMAIEKFGKKEKWVMQGQVMLDLATLYGKDNQYERFKVLSYDANNLFVAAKDSLGLITSLSNVGRSHQLLGQFDSAILYLYKSVEIIGSYKPKPLWAKVYLRVAGNTYNNLGIAYMEHGDDKMGMQFYNKAMEKKNNWEIPLKWAICTSILVASCLPKTI